MQRQAVRNTVSYNKSVNPSIAITESHHKALRFDPVSRSDGWEEWWDVIDQSPVSGKLWNKKNYSGKYLPSLHPQVQFFTPFRVHSSFIITGSALEPIDVPVPLLPKQGGKPAPSE